MADANGEPFDWADDAIEAAGSSVDENEGYSNDATHDQDHDFNVSLSQSNLWKWRLIEMQESSSEADADSLNESIVESDDTDYESEIQTDVQAPLKLEDTQPSFQASDRRSQNTSTLLSSPPNPPKPKPAYAWHHEWFRSIGGWVGVALFSENTLMPGPWGAHLLDSCLSAKRAVPFILPMDLTHEDFIVKGTKLAEWREVSGLGIEVKVEVLTTGECDLLGLDQTMRWRCKPSPLRRSWTLKAEQDSEEEEVLGEKESEEEPTQKRASHEEESQEEEPQQEDSEEEESVEEESREGVFQEDELLIFDFEEEWF
jgi:hypothetical protein